MKELIETNDTKELMTTFFLEQTGGYAWRNTVYNHVCYKKNNTKTNVKEVCADLRINVIELHELAHAFETIGNIFMYDKLFLIAEELKSKINILQTAMFGKDYNLCDDCECHVLDLPCSDCDNHSNFILYSGREIWDLSRFVPYVVGIFGRPSLSIVGTVLTLFAQRGVNQFH